MRTTLTILGLLLLSHQTAGAQLPIDFSLRPGRIEGEAVKTWGLRYEVRAAPTRIYVNRPRFPSAWSWAANLDGAVALRSRATTEPLVRGNLDLGYRIQFQQVASCPPQMEICPPPTTFDWGYLLLGVRFNGESDSRAEELQGALGLSALYRTPRGTQRGLWPLVPSASLDYSLVRPFASELRDDLGAELEAHERFTVAFIWNRIALTGDVPDWVSRARLEAEWRHFVETGVEAAVEDAEPTSGTFVALGFAYELTARLPYVRDVFATWSRGRHPTQERRKAWLIGLTLGSTR